jgi:5'-3' exonuclease
MGLSNIMQGGDLKVIGQNVLLIDFHNMLFRNLPVAYNLDPLDMEFVNWKYLMVNSIFYSVKRFKADVLVIAIDHGPSWRKHLYTEYKGTRQEGRDESPIDFEKFFPICEEFIEGLQKVMPNVYFLRKWSYEADDIIAVITKEFAAAHIVVNISTDKDFYQLFRYKGYRQWNPIKKEYIKVQNPKKFLEIKLLMGDSSDNIPQVKPRMGIKSAEKAADNVQEVFNDPEHGAAAKKQYIINKQLIDFDMIPQEIQSDIINMYKSYDFKPYKGRAAYDYFSRGGMAKVLRYIQEFNETISPLKSFDDLK